jgi:CubicO group peptidase (beta-lactamase class C family)
MKKYSIITCLMVLQIYVVSSQTITTAQPTEQVGISSKKLQKIDKEMNSWVAKGWMNGGAAIIIRKGKVVYHKAL